MSEYTEQQVFPYSLLVVSGPQAQTIQLANIFLKAMLPAQLHQVQKLWTHFNLTFAASVASGNRKITAITVQDAQTAPTFQRVLTGDILADATTRVIDKQIDLTSMLNPNGDNWIKLTFPYTPASGDITINLWKVDMLVTTIGIR
jgi:hypothetical protein